MIPKTMDTDSKLELHRGLVQHVEEFFHEELQIRIQSYAFANILHQILFSEHCILRQVLMLPNAVQVFYDIMSDERFEPTLMTAIALPTNPDERAVFDLLRQYDQPPHRVVNIYRTPDETTPFDYNVSWRKYE